MANFYERMQGKFKQGASHRQNILHDILAGKLHLLYSDVLYCYLFKPSIFVKFAQYNMLNGIFDQIPYDSY